MFQSCTSDADCNFCNAKCENQFLNRCEPKVGMGVVKSSQNDCFTTTIHPGVSFDKVDQLCFKSTTSGDTNGGTSGGTTGGTAATGNLAAGALTGTKSTRSLFLMVISGILSFAFMVK